MSEIIGFQCTEGKHVCQRKPMRIQIESDVWGKMHNKPNNRVRGNSYDMKGQRSTQREIWKATQMNDNTWCIIQFTNGIDLIFYFTWQQSDQWTALDDILGWYLKTRKRLRISSNSPYDIYRIATKSMQQQFSTEIFFSGGWNGHFDECIIWINLLCQAWPTILV